jgi:energy-coupling factor transporter transmembrane protein EcfT
MDISETILIILGALVIYGCAHFVLAILLRPNKAAWIVILLLFISAFCYLAFFLEPNVKRSIVLLSAKWGSFGLVLLSIQKVRGTSSESIT